MFNCKSVFFQFLTLLTLTTTSKLVWSLPPESTPQPLEHLLEQLATKQNFDIKGLSLTRDITMIPASGPIEEQLRYLLRDFNYIFVLDNEGHISRINLLSQKSSLSAQVVIPTTRHGQQHQLEVGLSQDGREWLSLEMIIDTGADMVVLPQSLLETLGISEGTLTEREIQTANGKIQAKLGIVKQLKLGQEILFDTNVAFLPDKQLGGIRLLGMNVLSLFRMTIDDTNSQITLSRMR